ncbi:MAG: response regulator [Rickettsiales bacterium]|nr:response regulator [Rickettsiales bacterium]
MNFKPKILVVEDEESISLLIRYNLEKAGFIVHQAFDGDEAIEKIDEFTPHLILLDWMLPSKNGVEILREIRRIPYIKNTPVIFLTARSQESDKLLGFEIGADDYISKPFSPKELLARVKSVLKRSNPNLFEESLDYENIALDDAKKTAQISGVLLDLTKTEFDLLKCFLENKERVLSRDFLLRKVWNDDGEIEGRAVDTSIRRLRQAMQSASNGSENLIKTIRGEGYILAKD